MRRVGWGKVFELSRVLVSGQQDEGRMGWRKKKVVFCFLNLGLQLLVRVESEEEEGRWFFKASK